MERLLIWIVGDLYFSFGLFEREILSKIIFRKGGFWLIEWFLVIG